MITAAVIVVPMCKSSTVADWIGAAEEPGVAVNPAARLI